MEFTQSKSQEIVVNGITMLGLANHGALCYAISVLHMLHQVPSIHQRVVNTERVDLPVINALKNVFNFISRSYIEVPAEQLLSALFSALYPDQSIDIMQQKDACEFFLDLISSFQSLPAECNPFVTTLRGELQHTMQSTNHPELRKQFTEKFFFLSIDVQNLRDLKASLQHFICPVNIQYRWKAGQLPQNSTKQVHILTPPSHLLLHLSRFKFDLEQKRKQKLNSFFSFPQLLDMTPYLAERDQGGRRCMYRLSAVVIHQGASAYVGHYYTLVRVHSAHTDENDDGDILEDRWVKMDNDRVTEYNVDMLAADAFGSLHASSDVDVDDGSDDDEHGSSIQSAKLLLYDLII
ncbi:hypothetical protein EON65_45885 [archaeon]|nr:MAG: hypothetical protein EON65_45885 [archaeon]